MSYFEQQDLQKWIESAPNEIVKTARSRADTITYLAFMNPYNGILSLLDKGKIEESHNLFLQILRKKQADAEQGKIREYETYQFANEVSYTWNEELKKEFQELISAYDRNPSFFNSLLEEYAVDYAKVIVLKAITSPEVRQAFLSSTEEGSKELRQKVDQTVSNFIKDFNSNTADQAYYNFYQKSFIANVNELLKESDIERYAEVSRHHEICTLSEETETLLDRCGSLVGLSQAAYPSDPRELEAQFFSLMSYDYVRNAFITYDYDRIKQAVTKASADMMAFAGITKDNMIHKTAIANFVEKTSSIDNYQTFASESGRVTAGKIMHDKFLDLRKNPTMSTLDTLYNALKQYMDAEVYKILDDNNDTIVDDAESKTQNPYKVAFVEIVNNFLGSKEAFLNAGLGVLDVQFTPIFSFTAIPKVEHAQDVKSWIAAGKDQETIDDRKVAQYIVKQVFYSDNEDVIQKLHSGKIEDAYESFMKALRIKQEYIDLGKKNELYIQEHTKENDEYYQVSWTPSLKQAFKELVNKYATEFVYFNDILNEYAVYLANNIKESTLDSIEIQQSIISSPEIGITTLKAEISQQFHTIITALEQNKNDNGFCYKEFIEIFTKQLNSLLINNELDEYVQQVITSTNEIQQDYIPFNQLDSDSKAIEYVVNSDKVREALEKTKETFMKAMAEGIKDYFENQSAQLGQNTYNMNDLTKQGPAIADSIARCIARTQDPDFYENYAQRIASCDATNFLIGTFQEIKYKVKPSELQKTLIKYVNLKLFRLLDENENGKLDKDELGQNYDTYETTFSNVVKSYIETKDIFFDYGLPHLDSFFYYI